MRDGYRNKETNEVKILRIIRPYIYIDLISKRTISTMKHYNSERAINGIPVERSLRPDNVDTQP